MSIEDGLEDGKSSVANERKGIERKVLSLRSTKTQYSPQYSMEETTPVRSYFILWYIYIYIYISPITEED